MLCSHETLWAELRLHNNFFPISTRIKSKQFRQQIATAIRTVKTDAIFLTFIKILPRVQSNKYYTRIWLGELHHCSFVFLCNAVDERFVKPMLETPYHIFLKNRVFFWHRVTIGNNLLEFITIAFLKVMHVNQSVQSWLWDVISDSLSSSECSWHEHTAFDEWDAQVSGEHTCIAGLHNLKSHVTYALF